MSRVSYVAAVDKVLKPMGFVRHGRDWVRQAGSIEQHVNLQSSQIAGTTANLWSKDLATEELLQRAVPWLRPATLFIHSTRIGYLTGRFDRWWKNDPNGPAEIAETLRAHAEAFFAGRRSLEDQARCASSPVELALTRYRMGQIDEACRVLEKIPKWLPDNGKRELESVRTWIAEQRPLDAERAPTSSGE